MVNIIHRILVTSSNETTVFEPLGFRVRSFFFIHECRQTRNELCSRFYCSISTRDTCFHKKERWIGVTLHETSEGGRSVARNNQLEGDGDILLLLIHFSDGYLIRVGTELLDAIRLQQFTGTLRFITDNKRSAHCTRDVVSPRTLSLLLKANSKICTFT